MIDLRSDTLTVPTEDMRRAIAAAKVGDDVFGEDPTVNELQKRVADTLGKEDSLFVSSGVMANQIAINILTEPGDEIITEADSHIFNFEAGSPAMISGVQILSVKTDNGAYEPKEIERLIKPEDDHFPRTSLVCVENTHNKKGGTIYPLDKIKELETIVRSSGLNFHCDGARLWEASAATGISLKEYAKPFDTVSVCLSKGLGAPVGSLICSKSKLIKKARRVRKKLGGGMRQVGIIAAGGLHAVENHFALLVSAQANARLFAELIAESDKIKLDVSSVETNIVIFRISQEASPTEFEKRCLNNGLKIINFGGSAFRAVFHFQKTEKEARQAAEIVKSCAESL